MMTARKTTPDGSKARAGTGKVRAGTGKAATPTEQTDSAAAGETKARNTEPDNSLRLQDLVAKLSEDSGVPRNQVVKVVKAMAAELGTAIRHERDIILPGLGKIKHQKRHDKENRTVSVVKVLHKDET